MTAAGCDAIVRGLTAEPADGRARGSGARARRSRRGRAGAGMEDGVAGPPFGEAAETAEAAEKRARPGVRLRPFAPFSGAPEADAGGGDWSFIDCEMEEVDLQDLPSATIACHLDPRVFVDGLCRVRSGPRGPSGGGRTLVEAARVAASTSRPAWGSPPTRAADGAGRGPSGTWRHPWPTCRGPLLSQLRFGSHSRRVPGSRAPAGPRARSQPGAFSAPRL